MICLIKKSSDIVFLIFSASYGALAFTVIPITYEELMARLSPYHLITVNVLITVGNQIVTLLEVQIFGYLFKNPSLSWIKTFQALVDFLAGIRCPDRKSVV